MNWLIRKNPKKLSTSFPSKKMSSAFYYKRSKRIYMVKPWVNFLLWECDFHFGESIDFSLTLGAKRRASKKFQRDVAIFCTVEKRGECGEQKKGISEFDDLSRARGGQRARVTIVIVWPKWLEQRGTEEGQRRIKKFKAPGQEKWRWGWGGGQFFPERQVVKTRFVLRSRFPAVRGKSCVDLNRAGHSLVC